MIVGNVNFRKEAITLRPKMVIASDRMELYEFWGRRTEVLGQQNRNWLKFAVAVTGVHFLLVQVP